jgi:gliding motility-associated-like protein
MKNNTKLHYSPRLFLASFFLLFSIQFGFTQGENNIWYFGNGAGMDFNTGSPVALNNSVMNTFEGCASIADANGDLLFYTDGISVWNRNHVTMPNGTGMGGDPSSCQSGIIVPAPGNPNQYYIITTDDFGGPNGLQYNVIDMTLDGGDGDRTTSNQVLYTPTTEKITAARHQNGQDAWIISHLANSTDFRIYPLTAAGIGAPINYTGTLHNGSSYGTMKMSASYDRLAICNQTTNDLEVLDFDNATGQLSNQINLTNSPGVLYGCEFSPDGQLLYASTWDSGDLFQYDLNAGNAAAINASMVSIFNTTANMGTIQAAPDGKIYVARLNQGDIGVINDPDVLGTGCNYVDVGFNLGGPMCQYGLPNFFVLINSNDFNYVNTCLGDTTFFTILDTANIDSVAWDFDDPASGSFNTSSLFDPGHVFTADGPFDVSVITWTGGVPDTIQNTVTITLTPMIFLGNDTTLCPGETLLLDASSSGASGYTWQDNSSNSTFLVTTAGTYYVTVSNGVCSSTDTIVVQFVSSQSVNLGANTTLCDGDVLTLDATLTGATYLWQDNSTNPTFDVTVAGTYWVQVNYSNCTTSDTITVSYNPIPAIDLGPDITLCDGDLTTIDGTTPGATYQWQDNSTGPTFNVSATGTYWVTVTVNNCSSTDSIDVNYVAYPVIDLGNDTLVCVGVAVPLNATVAGATYNWSNGSTNPVVNATEAGTYWVEVAIGTCVTTDTVTVLHENCTLIVPNVITPNGDGINDYFNVLGIDNGTWALNIYNRWGNLVYENADYANTWNGGDVTDGVYYYVITGGDNGDTYNGIVHVFKTR